MLRKYRSFRYGSDESGPPRLLVLLFLLILGAAFLAMVWWFGSIPTCRGACG